MTNRELYLFVTNLKSKPNIPSLENYLKSLWAIASPFSFAEPTIEDLVSWLEAALNYSPPEFDSEWLKTKLDFSKNSFESWENRIISQIVDLRVMNESGHLKNEMRYFGIDSPRGYRWYNFDVLTYLECAVRGMYDGYEEGEVIVLIQPPEGESADSELFEISQFSWDDFAEFLRCGQSYE
ncbi:MAG: hypothetical protein K1X72_10735 [Pyrinomonadaceae bacterium]|nr:hypothetical protein [Pyrinomonadaceae bacterium]